LQAEDEFEDGEFDEDYDNQIEQIPPKPEFSSPSKMSNNIKISQAMPGGSSHQISQGVLVQQKTNLKAMPDPLGVQ
jgi:hypothetical protein